MGLGTGGPLWENSARFRNGTLFVGLLRVPFFVAPRDLQARLQRGGEAECWTGVEGPLPMRRWEGIPIMPWA